jgi:uncharacterized protein YegJ (DUF2314 family)
MKRFCLPFFLLCFSFIIAQNVKDISGSLSEIGLYTMDAKLDESAIKKELKAIFPEISFIDDAPDTIDKTMAYVEVVDDVKADYPAHEVSYLEYFAEGFTKTQKEQLTTSKNAVILVLYYEKQNTFSHTKKLFDWIYKKVKDTDYVVYDGEVREYYLPKTWKRDRVDAWENGVPNALNLLTLHPYRKQEYCRCITFGMQRFGLPDLVINDSPCSTIASASQLLTIMGQLLLEGHEIKNNRLEVDLDFVKNAEVKKAISEVTYDNATKKATINFNIAAMEEGDPFNTIFQVDFKNNGTENAQTYESEVYKQLFGGYDEITHVSHDEEILAASERAKKRLPALRSLFNKGLELETLLLKAPFTTDDDGNEWMWIEVTRWQDETIEGILQNEPYYIKNLKAGAKVTVKQEDIFDYIIYKSDGTQEGNETGKLILKYGN